jgi:hypothetical protein
MPKSNYILPLVLVGGGFWWLSRQRAGASGTPNGYDIGSDYVVGRANVSGSIGNNIQMSTHLVEKDHGEFIMALVDWENTTTDFQGVGIPWNFKMHAELGHSTGWMGAGGWDNMNKLLGGQNGDQVAFMNNVSFGEHQKAFNNLQMGIEPNDGTKWDLRVTLFANNSDEQGNPIPDSWTEVGRATHQDAVIYRREFGYSIYGGNLGNITVNQNRGGSMRRLGMHAQRPPWGIAGMVDTRFPRSNRNMTLPGVDIMVRQDVSATGVGSPIGPGRRVYAV